jgi:hypothetical protein
VRQAAGPRQGGPKYTNYIVPAGKALTVPGWHVTNQRSDKFKVTAFADSAVAKEMAKANEAAIGTVTASFAAAWPVSAEPPPDEPAVKKGVGGDATGRGPPTEFKVQEVEMTVGALRASVSVRYTK